MEQKRSFLNKLIRLLVLAALAVGYLAVCSLSTTPLLKYNVGQDAAFFRLVGEGMTKGMLPYRDYFDMKGPYLFLMEYAGQLLLPGRLGAFAVQCVCLFVTLLFAHKCFDLGFPEKGCPLWAELLLLLPGAVMLSYTMTGGNLTEELSMPFLMPCLYLCLKYLGVTRIPSPENQDHPPLYGLYYGFAFGIMAMVRITNARRHTGAILLTVTCNLLVWKRFRNLFANAGMFLLGLLAGIAPACIWAACNGILEEMIAQVFAFGFAYSDEVGFIAKLWNLKTIWPCLSDGAVSLDRPAHLPGEGLEAVAAVCVRGADPGCGRGHGQLLCPLFRPGAAPVGAGRVSSGLECPEAPGQAGKEPLGVHGVVRCAAYRLCGRPVEAPSIPGPSRRSAMPCIVSVTTRRSGRTTMPFRPW